MPVHLSKGKAAAIIKVDFDAFTLLRNYGRSLYHIGIMQHNLGKHDQARASFEASRQIRDQILRDYAASPDQVNLKIDLLFSLVALGDHVHAVNEADHIQGAPLFTVGRGAPVKLYRLACIYSLSVAAVEDARRPKPLTPNDQKLQAAYRNKALTALEQAFAFGNRDFHTMRHDADLISSRDDPRFHRVLDLEKNKKIP